MIDKGVRWSSRNAAGKNALDLAAEHAALDNMMLLFPRATPEDQKTVLFSAVQAGVLDAVSRLLDAGIDVNTRNKDGQTPLMLAARFRHARLTTLLLERGADVGEKSTAGKTALDYARAAVPVNDSIVEQLVAASSGS